MIWFRGATLNHQAVGDNTKHPRSGPQLCEYLNGSREASELKSMGACRSEGAGAQLTRLRFRRESFVFFVLISERMTIQPQRQ